MTEVGRGDRAVVIDEVATRREARAARRAQQLIELLERRPDLEGVYGPADVAAESLRWSV